MRQHFEAVFEKINTVLLIETAQHNPTLLFEFFFFAVGNITSLYNYTGRKGFFQTANYCFLKVFNSGCCELNDQNIIIFVNNQAGDSVSLAENDSIASGIRLRS